MVAAGSTADDRVSLGYDNCKSTVEGSRDVVDYEVVEQVVTLAQQESASHVFSTLPCFQQQLDYFKSVRA
jgi:hypothetical protein